ncbi:MAG: hypothetical protein M0P12_00070 [Paludibacteraceae bacterium]|nr:hypothetical protein [Paludibacteraceae bacterium]MCK9615755.1 hypothetical protein [Candidatus Omnitrophota bacterium]
MTTENELKILRHSLGTDWEGNLTWHRNFYDPAGEDISICESLLAKGYMTKEKTPTAFIGNNLFYVTEKGKQFVRENEPVKKVLTRSQERYRKFIRENSCLDFGEWLKKGWYK